MGATLRHHGAVTGGRALDHAGKHGAPVEAGERVGEVLGAGQVDGEHGAVHVGAPLDWNASRDNLVMLNRWFVMRCYRAERLRFWQAYCRSRAANGIVRCFHPVAPSPRDRVVFPQWAKDLESRTRVSNLEFWRGRDQR